VHRKNRGAHNKVRDSNAVDEFIVAREHSLTVSASETVATITARWFSMDVVAAFFIGQGSVCVTRDTAFTRLGGVHANVVTYRLGACEGCEAQR
jgi:hypothetical protein